MRRLTLLLLAGCASAEAFTVEAPDYGPPPQADVAAAPRGTVDAGVAHWPKAGALLSAPMLTLPSGKRYRVLIDAGHGAKGNDGNVGLHCQRERDVTLSLAVSLALRLAALGPFEVKLAREKGAEPSYQARKALAEAWPADAVVSLHTDARGQARPYVQGDCTSWRNDDAPGFSVLWSREGGGTLAQERQALSWALTDAMSQAGFLPYAGEDYAGLYDVEPEHVGSFINDRGHGKRIWFLRSLKVPTVIIETHHALDYDEVERFSELHTRDVFARAVAKGLLDYFGRR